MYNLATLLHNLRCDIKRHLCLENKSIKFFCLFTFNHLFCTTLHKISQNFVMAVEMIAWHKSVS